MWLASLWGGLSGATLRRVVSPVVLALILVFVGARPAVLRAVGMGVVAWAALSSGRRPLRWHGLALVAGGLVLWRPDLLRDLGFQLSLAATTGILAALELAPGRRNRDPHLADGLRVGLGAQLATAPWVWPIFSLASPWAALHGLWAVPWASAVLILGLAWLVLASLSSTWASASVALLDLAASPLVALGELPAGSWFSQLWSGSWARPGLVLLAGIWCLARRGWLPAALALLVLAASFVPSREPAAPELVMLDVGQGDALLLRDGAEAVLVDGGGWSSGDIAGRVLVPALARAGCAPVACGGDDPRRPRPLPRPLGSDGLRAGRGGLGVAGVDAGSLLRTSDHAFAGDLASGVGRVGLGRRPLAARRAASGRGRSSRGQRRLARAARRGGELRGDLDGATWRSAAKGG